MKIQFANGTTRTVKHDNRYAVGSDKTVAYPSDWQEVHEPHWARVYLLGGDSEHMRTLPEYQRDKLLINQGYEIQEVTDWRYSPSLGIYESPDGDFIHMDCSPDCQL